MQDSAVMLIKQAHEQSEVLPLWMYVYLVIAYKLMHRREGSLVNIVKHSQSGAREAVERTVQRQANSRVTFGKAHGLLSKAHVWLVAAYELLGSACGLLANAYAMLVQYLSVGSTCTYLELPATKVTTASNMATAGIAKPIVQLTLSCMYTRVVTARKEPRLIAK